MSRLLENIKPEDLTEDEVKDFLDEINRLYDQYEMLAAISQIPDDKNAKIAVFERLCNERMLVDAQKEAFAHLDSGGYLN